MAKADKNRLTLDVIQKSNKMYEEMVDGEITLLIEGEPKTFTLGLYKAFSPVKIKGMFTEYLKNIDIARASNKGTFDGILQPYLLYMLIKHFTTLGESMPRRFQDQLESMEYMINTGTFWQIIALLDEGEVSKIKKELDYMLALAESKEDLIDYLTDEYFGKIENKELLD